MKLYARKRGKFKRDVVLVLTSGLFSTIYLNMEFVLEKYIESYIQNTDYSEDKKIALHLKEIIPSTSHLAKDTLNEIIEALKKEMDNGKDFKVTFQNVCPKYILTGDTIQGKLPRLLTRIIIDDTEFLEKVSEEYGVPSSRDDIKKIVDSKDKDNITGLFRNIELNIRKVVFATFDENNMEADPFVNHTLKAIIGMLALNKRLLRRDIPLTAVSIRYKNKDDILKRFPVFTDAGWYDKFYPSEKHDKYGRTKPLDKSLKSMPEVVHENLKIADVIEEIRFLND